MRDASDTLAMPFKRTGELACKTTFIYRPTGDEILEHADDLFFRESFLHCHSFGNGLYIDFVLITGSRSVTLDGGEAATGGAL